MKLGPEFFTRYTSIIVAKPVGIRPKKRIAKVDFTLGWVLKSENRNELGKIITAAKISAPALKEILDTDWGDLLVIIDPVA